MELLDFVLAQYAGSLKSLQAALGDIPDADLARQYPGLNNHPAWTLEHLCLAAGLGIGLLGDASGFPSRDMMTRFGPGSKPSPERDDFGRREELLARLAALHAKLDAAVRLNHRTRFNAVPPEPFRAFAPTVGHIVTYLVTSHEPYHLGQVISWRKAAGLPAL